MRFRGDLIFSRQLILHGREHMNCDENVSTVVSDSLHCNSFHVIMEQLRRKLSVSSYNSDRFLVVSLKATRSMKDP